MRKIEQGDWFGLLHFGKNSKIYERSEINLTKISLQIFPKKKDYRFLLSFKAQPKKFEKKVE